MYIRSRKTCRLCKTLTPISNRKVIGKRDAHLGIKRNARLVIRQIGNCPNCNNRGETLYICTHCDIPNLDYLRFCNYCSYRKIDDDAGAITAERYSMWYMNNYIDQGYDNPRKFESGELDYEAIVETPDFEIEIRKFKMASDIVIRHSYRLVTLTFISLLIIPIPLLTVLFTPIAFVWRLISGIYRTKPKSISNIYKTFRCLLKDLYEDWKDVWTDGWFGDH